MARPAIGSVLERAGKRGTSFALRFTLPTGERRQVRLGTAAQGWTQRRAEDKLQEVLADVRRGLPNVIAAPPPEKVVPTFAEFAHRWFEAQKLEGGRRGAGLSSAGVADLEWRIVGHLLPCFGAARLDQITVEDVDKYRQAKVAAGRLSAGSINKTLNTLAAILERAEEYELVPRNVAKGKRRKLAAAAPRRTYMDRADHIGALLDAAGRLDRERARSRPWRRALLATLVFGGLRISEALALEWRDVDLAGGRLVVRGTKTDAAERVVRLLPALRDELVRRAADAKGRVPGALVFATGEGTAHTATNVRRRVLAPAVGRANAGLLEQGEALPDGLTPHSLRRTFASLHVALGTDPAVLKRQMGHKSASMTMNVYADAMDWRDGERERLRALVDGGPFSLEQSARLGADRAQVEDRGEAGHVA